jgi:short-subunit dehydrogenase
MKNFLVLGASSLIVQKTLELLAKPDVKFYLVGRNEAKLNIVKAHLESVGQSSVFIETADLMNFDAYKQIFSNSLQAMGYVDCLFVGYGILPNQQELEQDITKIIENFNVNALGVILFASLVANYFEARNYGSIVVISSVAGDRGRRNNYFYGSAKAALTVFLQGLRHRFAKKNIKVITIKPGLVDTPMTAHLEKNLLYSNAEKVAKDIFFAISRNKEIVYTPWFWRYIMMVIKLLPEKIFKRLNF